MARFLAGVLKFRLLILAAAVGVLAVGIVQLRGNSLDCDTGFVPAAAFAGQARRQGVAADARIEAGVCRASHTTDTQASTGDRNHLGVACRRGAGGTHAGQPVAP